MRSVGKKLGSYLGAGWPGLAGGTDDGDSAGDDGGGAAVVADGNVFVVGEKRLVGTEELADAGGVVDGGVEVGVVGDVDGSAEGRAGDGVEGGFGCLPAVRLFVGVEERGEGFAEERPGAMAEGQERIEDRSLTGFDQGWGEQAGGGAGVEVEEVSADGDAEMLLAFVFEGSVGQVGEREVCCGFIGFGEPAFSGTRRFVLPWGMIAPMAKGLGVVEKA